jgi:hypothetical protein
MLNKLLIALTASAFAVSAYAQTEPKDQTVRKAVSAKAKSPDAKESAKDSAKEAGKDARKARKSGGRKTLREAAQDAAKGAK